MVRWGLILRACVEALIIFGFSIVLPMIILFLSWGDTIPSQSALSLWTVMYFITFVNGISKLSDVIVVIIPLASLYIFTGARCILNFRRVISKQIDLLVLIPIVVLLYSQVVLSMLLVQYHDQPLAGHRLLFASGAIYGALIGLIAVDVFRLYFEAASRISEFRQLVHQRHR